MARVACEHTLIEEAIAAVSEASEQNGKRRHREKLVPVNIRMSSGARDALRQQAEREGLTLSTIIRKACMRIVAEAAAERVTW